MLYPTCLGLHEDQLRSVSSVVRSVVYIGRRLSMLSIDESVDVRPFPLSVTRSVIRMLGLVAD
jgi:hypothetical protein